MGNCCDSVDFKLSEIFELNHSSNKEKSKVIEEISSPRKNSTENLDDKEQELKQMFIKFRNKKNKLKTIIEENQEYSASSPLLVRKKLYE